MKLAFLNVKSKQAQELTKKLQKRFAKVAPHNADVIVVLGGDGFMLQTLRQYIEKKYTQPVYGINMGTVGFLMNNPSTADELPARIDEAGKTILHPLKLNALCQNKEQKQLLAINEVSLFRQTAQTAHFRIKVDGRLRLEELYADGVILASAAGSTAYNYSAGGTIIPIGADVLALTPINPFRPRRWKGGLLPASVKVRFEVKESKKRSVSAAADNEEIRDIIQADIFEDKTISLPLLFDKDHDLEERIISEQFKI